MVLALCFVSLLFAATPRPENQEKLLAMGKKLFVARCASCHNERGDKPLAVRGPLNERKIAEKDLARIVAGRLKDQTEQQKRAVTLYILSLMKKEP